MDRDGVLRCQWGSAWSPAELHLDGLTDAAGRSRARGQELMNVAESGPLRDRHSALAGAPLRT